MRKLFKYYAIFMLFLILSFLIIYVFMPLGCDNVWLYGFSYNISKGLVIYRDFNVVTTPLYYIIGSLFVHVLGDYIIVTGVYNSLLIAFIMLLMYKMIGMKSFILYPLLLIFFPNGYNLFSLFWLVLILYLICIKKDNEILIGFIVGLLFITKQSVGVLLFLPYFFYCKHKIRGMFIFLVPFIVVSIYLLLNGAFFQFIDCCFLGMFEFGSNNHYYDIFAFCEIVVLFYLLYKLVKSKFNNRECFYILCFQIIMYPLMDCYHFFVCFFPVMYLIINDIKIKNILFLLFVFIYMFSGVLFFSVDHKVNFKKNVLYLTNSGDLSLLMEEFHDYLKDVDNYYFTGYYGYLYKLYWNIPITNYDLWNSGNMGYNGFEKRIAVLNDKCAEESCVFIVDRNLLEDKKSQVIDFYSYIVKNYTYKEEKFTFDIYTNMVEGDDKGE